MAIICIVGLTFFKLVEEYCQFLFKCSTFKIYCKNVIWNGGFLRHIWNKCIPVLHNMAKMYISYNFQVRVAINEQNNHVKKHMAPLKIKINPGSSISIIKNPLIHIFCFRVAKICISGFPYLWRTHRYNLKKPAR